MSQASTKDRAEHEEAGVLVPWCRKTKKPRTVEKCDEAQREFVQHHHNGWELHLVQAHGGDAVVHWRAEPRTTSKMCPWAEVEQEYEIVYVLDWETVSRPLCVNECHGESCVVVASCQ